MRALWGGAQDAFQGWWLTPTLGVGHWPERALVGQRLGEAWGECWSGGERPFSLFLETNAGMGKQSSARRSPSKGGPSRRGAGVPCVRRAETPGADREI